MIKEGLLNQNLMSEIQRAFLEKYQFDRIINKESKQPKYVISEIGGWVCFDLIYKNSISIKYQSMFDLRAKNIIEFIEQQINASYQ